MPWLVARRGGPLSFLCEKTEGIPMNDSKPAFGNLLTGKVIPRMWSRGKPGVTAPASH